MVEATIVAVSYEQARSEFFETKISECKRKMKYWEIQKKKIGRSYLSRANDHLSELGWEINFYMDALNALNVEG